MKTVTLERLEEAREGYEGWCTECQDFTTGAVEPDADGYECERCGAPAVVGAEDAAIRGLFRLVE